MRICLRTLPGFALSLHIDGSADVEVSYKANTAMSRRVHYRLSALITSYEGINEHVVVDDDTQVVLPIGVTPLIAQGSCDRSLLSPVPKRGDR
jgi:hypothetical protein